MQKPPVSVAMAPIPPGQPLGATSLGAGPTRVLFDLFGAGLSDAVFISLPSLEGAASSARAPVSRHSETPPANPERAHFDIEAEVYQGSEGAAKQVRLTPPGWALARACAPRRT